MLMNSSAINLIRQSFRPAGIIADTGSEVLGYVSGMNKTVHTLSFYTLTRNANCHRIIIIIL